MSSGSDDGQRCKGIVFGTDDAAGVALLDDLRADGRIEFIDNVGQQSAGLRGLKPAPPAEITAEPTRWVYYPWRRTVVSVLGPRAFRLVRLDRNRNLITTDELDRLGQLRIGVVGLSVGHAIAYTLAAQGLCGELRLADFDDVELSNLNRVPASVLDLGVNKAVVCARRIAELDPYLPVTVTSDGVTPQTVGDFLEGLDIVIEECDSLDAKLLVREAARARRLPVLMATSDRGLLDVERFDIEPSRPLMHGLLGDLDAARLGDLGNRDKLPYALRMTDATRVSPRMAASLVEVGKTLSTWPQLSSEVALNVSVVAEAVRRIGLHEKLPSGRVRIDTAAVLDELAEPPVTPLDPPPIEEAPQQAAPAETSEIIAAAIGRAPSGGNAQPWRIEAHDGAIRIQLAPEHTTAMDVQYRASAVALGAATFNARVAAAAHGFVSEVDFQPGDESSPLNAIVRLTAGVDPELTAMYDAMLRRETNRRRGERIPIAAQTRELLGSAARAEGARLQILSESTDLGCAATVLAAADRIRYLTPRLHGQMFAELRFPGDPAPESGIDIRTLELDPADLVMLDILRRPEVMTHLAAWDAGTALGDDTYERVTASAAIGIISVSGKSLADYAQGGSAAESVWITAQQHGLAVQPVSPAFLYAHDDEDLRELSPAFAGELRDLQYNFRKLANTEVTESQVLVLRFSRAPRPSVASRRRGLQRVSSPTG
ncbi:dinucleotide-utilizing enzyme possibly involved in molybdopterin or thiamin biosynthesis [Mycobacterium sp. JS623]|uniref:Rv1355c family protein n=1 Tax=Mycobacterium sp. JS623 TaxID=212767 RepID=UPI0002A5945A|nr:Rv1355c family protein [Mycobacterium sp. JS623]AGB22447.1 dinucleotide-utilizing enzyme possibly involved in molybdopterin or thiamin biosynthesis [Mycobacterium sp. JS623]